MEEGADWDSDETVIEGSVTESEQEEEELPWRRLLFDQDTSLRGEFSLHPGISGTCKGTHSPEIQLIFKLGGNSQEQMSENKMMPLLSEDAALQQPQDEMEQNQALLQTRKSSPMFTVSCTQAELSLNHQSVRGTEAENPEVLPHPEKELSAGRDSPEISLLSGTTTEESSKFAVKEKSLIEPKKILAAPNTFSEPGKEVVLTVTSKETKDEESSLETFVSALEGLLTSPEITQEERLFGIVSNFKPRELMNPLSNSLSSLSMPLTCHEDLLENTKDDALPAELLAALNTLSEAKVEPICHRKEGGICLSTGNECLEVEPSMSQIDEDCTQVAEVNFETLCSAPPFEQDSRLAELQNKHLSVQQTLEDPNPLGLQTLVHQNVASYNPLNNKGNSNPVENHSDQDTPCVLRRSSRLKAGRVAKPTNDIYKMPEKILPKILGCEDQANSNSSTENFRMQNLALRIEGKGKTVHSSRLKSREQIRKNKKFTRKNEKMKMNKMSLSNINRRNIFGENLLYKAALHNDAGLVHHYIKKGGNVNQPSYAGWTALHEASVGGFYQVANELLKGGADVNIRGMYQITPLQDAVMNGHYKVAELLLLNGADPLCRNDNGKCALDEAKDLCMKRLLERYVSKHKRHLTSAQKNSTDPSDREDAHQHKKPKFSSKNHSGFACDENSNRQKPEHAKVNKEGKDSLFINKEAVYEYYQKDSQSRKFGKSKYKQSALNQKYSTGLRKDNLHNVRNPSTNVSKGKGRRYTRHKRIQVDHIIQESNPRKTIAVSSSRRTNKLVPHQQQILQTLDHLPEKSCKPSSSAPSGLKIGLGNNMETCSVSKETHTQSLDLSDSQEIKFLGLESIDQVEAVSFSGLFLNKTTKLPPVTADQQPQTHQDQQHTSPCKSYENSNSDQKDESHNKWENSSPSFIKENFNDGDDDTGSRASGETVKSKKVVSFSDYKNQDNYKENITNREEMDFQQFLPSEDHFSQGNAFKADNLTILPQQEAINFSNSGNIMVSEHVPDDEQCACRTSFDHLHGSPEHTSSACTRAHSIHEVSKLTSHAELFERPQDCSYRTSAPLMNQTDAHTVEKVNKKGDAERNYTDKGQKTSSSNSSLSTVVHSQVIETTKVEKRRQGNKTIHNMDFHSTDNISKELTSISQLSQREEKEISHKAGNEELTIIVNGDESTIRNCEEKKEKTDLEIHMPTNIQEHKKVKNLRKKQNFLKATCSQGWTPLREAASEGCNDTIVELLKANAKVNCENLDGILPLHDAVANNHLKATEILLQHGANPNQKDKKQKTALDEADDENTKELLKSYGAVETDNRAEANAVVTVKTSAVWSKRHKQCFCDDCKTVDIPSLSNQGKKVENLPMHQNISAILQDIEEKQENLLEFEIRTPEDAEQYIGKMLEVKEVMDNVLAKQKAERDDLAKKYRVSMESFKQGVLREQLVNLATRQKSLLTVTKNQKKIREKIHNYKNVTPLSGLSFKKLPSSSEMSNGKSRQEFTSLETSVQPQSGSLSPVSLVYGSMQETQLSSEIWHDSQNTNTCLNSKRMRREGFSGNELNSKRNISDYTLDRLSKSRHSDGTKKIKLPSQSVTFITQAEYSQKENDLTDMAAKEHASFRPSAVTGALNISETTSVLSHNEPYPSAVLCNQAFSSCDPKRDNRKTASQQPPRGASESLAHREIHVFGSNTGHQMKPYLKKSAVAVPHANDSQSSSSSESSRQHTIKKPLNYSTAPKKKCMQIKDLILLGRINPGNNILEFKTQETTHKASVLLSGKIKVESGQIYQNPVTWLKDVLGGDSYVTWNYAWSKVTYQGKELLKYVSEELPTPPDPNLVPQQRQPCPPGMSGESMQSIPHYLQINEILLVSEQEFLPCHIMDEHWKFYVECEELTF
ncbi:ankyrin repeat domain-containing protein 31 isoform X6 [Vicugna pacos]|uniref:Ankyrin repeat domain-containing protein 31 isoform X6 n=1 Tax=Vicugna pacos TaxID=30538 RepID=A0ABM5D118_VICPA